MFVSWHYFLPGFTSGPLDLIMPAKQQHQEQITAQTSAQNIWKLCIKKTSVMVKFFRCPDPKNRIC